MSNIKVSDLVPNYSEKHYKEAQAVMEELHKDTMTYASLDNLYDMETMERIKRSMVGNLEFLGEHYARVKKFKTIGDYLEETRKAIKAEAIDIVANEQNLSVNQAKEIVYAHPYYKDRIEVLQQLKAFFILVEAKYDRYTDVLNNIRQSLSLVRKDPNFKPVEDED